MYLIDLDPRCGCDADIIVCGVKKHFENRQGMAVSFECPHCVAKGLANNSCYTRLAVWFANPIDGLPPTDNASFLWQRTGDNFGILTLSPSIDASKEGHWHGHIINGMIQ